VAAFLIPRLATLESRANSLRSINHARDAQTRTKATKVRVETKVDGPFSVKVAGIDALCNGRSGLEVSSRTTSRLTDRLQAPLHCCLVSKNMRTYPFVDQRRSLLSSECYVLSDHVLHSVSAEPVTPRIREQELRRACSPRFFSARAEAAAIPVSLEIILRGFLVVTLRRCLLTSLAFFIPGLKISSHAIS